MQLALRMMVGIVRHVLVLGLSIGVFHVHQHGGQRCYEQQGVHQRSETEKQMLIIIAY